VNIYKSLFTN